MALKKITALLLLLTLFVPFVHPAAAAAETLNVVATVFPIWDWTREIAKDVPDLKLTLLQGNGVDLHSFQPSAADLMKVASCDVFIYVGGESDAWVKDALAESINPNLISVNLMEALGEDVRPEETPEGAEPAHDHGDEAPEADEHIWLSLKNAEKLVTAIAEALRKADPVHGDLYTKNAELYVEKLSALDEAYAGALKEAPLHTLLFGDRFPFLYLVRDYGLTYDAAFSGCEAETEASFDTVIFLAAKLDQLELPAVLTLEGSDHRIAETIIRNTSRGDQAILELNSMQGITAADAASGTTYLSIMEANLGVLRQALGNPEP